MSPDRYGEPVEPDEHECDNGFIDRDADPPLHPCLICRPRLSGANLRRAVLDADQLRADPTAAQKAAHTNEEPRSE